MGTVKIDFSRGFSCRDNYFGQPAISLGNSTAALCIGDVAGKGLPAALVMSNMQASVRGLAPRISSPAEMCRELNRLVLKNTRSERLTTFFYGILDSTRGVLRYCNAGHIPPFLVRENGSVQRLSEGGIVFGVSSDRDYEEAEAAFGPNDRLVLLTDGITEAMNAQGEEFGDGRIIDLLRRNRNLAAADLQRELLQAVDLFAAEGLRDDATLVTVSLKSGILHTS